MMNTCKHLLIMFCHYITENWAMWEANFNVKCPPYTLSLLQTTPTASSCNIVLSIEDELLILNLYYTIQKNIFSSCSYPEELSFSGQIVMKWVETSKEATYCFVTWIYFKCSNFTWMNLKSSDLNSNKNYIHSTNLLKIEGD